MPLNNPKLTLFTHTDGTIHDISTSGNLLSQDYINKISKTDIIHVRIGTNITTLGNHVFSDCYNLKSITIPDSVTSLIYGTFKDCVRLESIDLPNSLTHIGWDSFKNCINLTSATFGERLTEIEDQAFMNTPLLTRVNIPNTVSIIGPYSFYNSGLTNVYIPTINNLNLSFGTNQSFFGSSGITINLYEP